MKIQPLNDWAVIIPSEAAVRTAGGLFIPDAAKETPAEGTVEAIGPGALEEEKWGDRKKEEGKKKERKFIPTSVKPGERVMYERFAGQKITVGGSERVLVRETNILGILPPKAADPKQDLPPLMIPAVTSATSSSTALMTRRATDVQVKKEAAKPAVIKAAGSKGRGKTTAKKTSKKKKPAAKAPAKPKKKAAGKPKKTAATKAAPKRKTKKKR